MNENRDQNGGADEITKNSHAAELSKLGAAKGGHALEGFGKASSHFA